MSEPSTVRKVSSLCWSIGLGLGLILVTGAAILPSTKSARVQFKDKDANVTPDSLLPSSKYRTLDLAPSADTATASREQPETRVPEDELIWRTPLSGTKSHAIRIPVREADTPPTADKTTSIDAPPIWTSKSLRVDFSRAEQPPANPNQQAQQVQPNALTE